MMIHGDSCDEERQQGNESTPTPPLEAAPPVSPSPYLAQNHQERQKTAAKSEQQRRRGRKLLAGVLLISIAFIAAIIGILVSTRKGGTDGSRSQSANPGSGNNSNNNSTSGPDGEDSNTPPSSMPADPFSVRPSSRPSDAPSVSVLPSLAPSAWPTEPIAKSATFYAVGDVPYSTAQAEQLTVQMSSIPEDAEFVVHVGDIRKAVEGRYCRRPEYEEAASILRLSHAPVFVLLGDNDWNDCANPQVWSKRPYCLFIV